MSDSPGVSREHHSVTDWINDFDHTDARWTEDPFPIWEELRAHSPVVHTERFLGCWISPRAALRLKSLTGRTKVTRLFTSNQHS